ncbi:Uncharacterised protein [Actinobacillus pleuropneumoniae]|nr:Uncharacterised protein [Actinobacillus pleuropneumoniae]
MVTIKKAAMIATSSLHMFMPPQAAKLIEPRTQDSFQVLLGHRYAPIPFINSEIMIFRPVLALSNAASTIAML